LLWWEYAEAFGVEIEAVGERPYDELCEFAAYQRVKEERRDKHDFYLAQIAAFCSGQEKPKLADFLAPVDEDSEPMKLDNPVYALAKQMGAKGI